MYRILMHICCAPDATVGFERLSPFGKVLGYFYNPNIEPLAEYHRREAEARRLAGLMKFDYREGRPDRQAWRTAVAGFEDEPERGERCRRCIEHNLEAAAKAASELNIPAFATTLTISPHKDVDYIHARGAEIAGRHGLEYIAETLRKKDGFKQSLVYSKKYGLYRQDYCGCRWSIRREHKRNRSGLEQSGSAVGLELIRK